MLAIIAAKEQGWLDLSDALSLVELMAAQQDDLFERAGIVAPPLGLPAGDGSGEA